MAAYGALVSLVNDLELIPNHPIHSFCFNTKQITSLSKTVHFLIGFMESYDSHGWSREAAEIWESRIASAAHVAQDVIESQLVDQIHGGFTLGGREKPRSYFFLELQKASDNMKIIMREAMQLQAEIGMKMEQLTYSPPPSSETLTSKKNVMVGLDDVVSQLMELVIGGPSSRRVVPIVGMGGMGKTTLARNLYEHSLIRYHFDVHLWATITQEYSVEEILTQLLFGERNSTNGGNVGELGEKLHKKLWGRRYFIILDDLWSEGAWDKIRIFLPDDGNGSCVVVTTRLSNLAAYLSCSSFKMNFLDEDRSWELFCEKAFGGEDCLLELEETGKKIVKRCRGLPLSIVVIGGHLRRSSTATEYWEKVADLMNPISSLEADDQCLNVISLSYHYLPNCLKPCFLHMRIFNEDEVIYAPTLIKFWVAEGFIRAKEGLSLEEVAEGYLNDLIERNLILLGGRSWNGKVEGFVIHDIVREVCVKVGKKEKFVYVVEDTAQNVGCMERRIVIPKGKCNSDVTHPIESAGPLLSSLMRRLGPLYFDQLTIELRLLRVSANVSDMYVDKDDTCFPGAHFQQLNLRYLDFYLDSRFGERRYVIPSSMFRCWNLQTLTIRNRDVQITIPDEIWEMSQLRHLEFVQARLPCPPPTDHQECIVLQSLHTIEGVEDLRLTDEVCKRIPNIKKLYVMYNHLPADSEASSYYCSHNLGCLSKLESLICAFGDDSKWRDFVVSFMLPCSLEELSLSNSQLHWNDLTMMIKILPHLGSLQFDSIQGPEWDLADEVFPCLKILRISKCDDLSCWNAESSHFPILENLQIWTTPKLSEIPFDIGGIATLRRIELHFCSLDAAVSAMKIAMEQEELGNDDFKLNAHFWEMKQVERFQDMIQEESITSNGLLLTHRYTPVARK